MSADGGGSFPVGRPSPRTGPRSSAAMPDFSPAIGVDVRSALRAAASADAVDAAPVEIVAPLAPPVPATRSARRLARAPRGLRALVAHPAWTFVVGAAVVVAAWAGVPPIAQSIGSIAHEPAVLAVVEDYIAALQAHDAEAASAMVAPDGAVASTSLLTNAVYDGVVVPDSFTIGPVRIAGDEAFVPVVLGGELWRPAAAVQLELDGGTWRLVSGLAVPVRATPGFVSIAEIEGQPVPAAIAAGEQAVWLYPGTYWVSPASTPLLDGQSPYALEVDASTTELHLDATPSIALEQSMRLHASSLVAACLAATAPGCGDIAQDAAGGVTISASPEQVETPDDSDLVVLEFAVTITDGATVSVHAVVVTADLANVSSPRDDAHVTLVGVVLGAPRS